MRAMRLGRVIPVHGRGSAVVQEGLVPEPGFPDVQDDQLLGAEVANNAIKFGLG